MKGIGLKNLPIDSHLGLEMVGAASLLQCSVVHNTNSNPPTLDSQMSSRQVVDIPLLKWPNFLFKNFNWYNC